MALFMTVIGFFHGEEIAIYPAAIFLFFGGLLIVIIRRIEKSRFELIRILLIFIAVILFVIGVFFSYVALLAYFYALQHYLSS